LQDRCGHRGPLEQHPNGQDRRSRSRPDKAALIIRDRAIFSRCAEAVATRGGSASSAIALQTPLSSTFIDDRARWQCRSLRIRTGDFRLVWRLRLPLSGLRMLRLRHLDRLHIFGR
jgi:hypothetical protein